MMKYLHMKNADENILLGRFFKDFSIKDDYVNEGGSGEKTQRDEKPALYPRLVAQRCTKMSNSVIINSLTARSVQL